jgi:RNA recognition motif-containing protein
VNKSTAKVNDQDIHERKLFVKGLPLKGTSEEEVHKFFSHFGKVDRVLMGYNTKGQLTFRGFAYVVMENKNIHHSLVKKGTLKFKGQSITI